MDNIIYLLRYINVSNKNNNSKNKKNNNNNNNYANDDDDDDDDVDDDDDDDDVDCRRHRPYRAQTKPTKFEIWSTNFDKFKDFPIFTDFKRVQKVDLIILGAPS